MTPKIVESTTPLADVVSEELKLRGVQPHEIQWVDVGDGSHCDLATFMSEVAPRILVQTTTWEVCGGQPWTTHRNVGCVMMGDGWWLSYDESGDSYHNHWTRGSVPAKPGSVPAKPGSVPAKPGSAWGSAQGRRQQPVSQGPPSKWPVVVVFLIWWGLSRRVRLRPGGRGVRWGGTPPPAGRHPLRGSDHVG
jgi:hypothetical protein